MDDEDSDIELPEATQWRKLLYMEQPFPDNYTHILFLDQLKRNTTVAKYSFGKLFHDFSLIALYMTLLLMTNLTFSGIFVHSWPPYIPTMTGTALGLTGFILIPVLAGEAARSIKLYIVIALMLLLLSPVLRSLTKSTSLDSIWAISTILTCLNVLCHDYALEESSHHKSIVSTNLSFANGIVLASRLLLSTNAFCFLVFSSETSILLPILDVRLRQLLARFHYVFMICAYISCAVLTYSLHGMWLVLVYLCGVTFVLLCLPWYFLSLQQYKNELQGPWDPAKPKLNVQK